VYAQLGAKRLRMVMTVDVDAEEFVKAFHKGVDRNTPPDERPKLAERMGRFDAVVRALSKLKKKDVIDLDHLPDRGLLLSYNGKPRGEPIAGEDLYAALLRCFIGDKPVDPELKIGLLGGPVG
jgi:Chalcone isomerase-like